MPSLNIQTETVYSIDSFDLATFITEVYNLPNEFEILESPNDSTHRYSVKKEPLDEWEQEDLEEAKEDCSIEYVSVGTILTDLANQDLIPEGTYLMEVCW